MPPWTFLADQVKHLYSEPTVALVLASGNRPSFVERLNQHRTRRHLAPVIVVLQENALALSRLPPDCYVLAIEPAQVEGAPTMLDPSDDGVALALDLLV